MNLPASTKTRAGADPLYRGPVTLVLKSYPEVAKSVLSQIHKAQRRPDLSWLFSLK